MKRTFAPSVWGIAMPDNGRNLPISRKFAACLNAFFAAAFVGAVLTGMVGAIALAANDLFGLGAIASYIAAGTLGGLSLYATVWVFRGALQFERNIDSEDSSDRLGLAEQESR